MTKHYVPQGRYRQAMRLPAEELEKLVRRAVRAYLDTDMTMTEWRARYGLVEREAMERVSPEQRHRMRELRQYSA